MIEIENGDLMEEKKKKVCRESSLLLKNEIHLLIKYQCMKFSINSFLSSFKLKWFKDTQNSRISYDERVNEAWARKERNRMDIC